MAIALMKEVIATPNRTRQDTTHKKKNEVRIRAKVINHKGAMRPLGKK
jgi:hypothetical protein